MAKILGGIKKHLLVPVWQGFKRDMVLSFARLKAGFWYYFQVMLTLQITWFSIVTGFMSKSIGEAALSYLILFPFVALQAALFGAVAAFQCNQPKFRHHKKVLNLVAVGIGLVLAILLIKYVPRPS